MRRQADLTVPKQRNISPITRRLGLHKYPSVKERIISKVLHNLPRSSSTQVVQTTSSDGAVSGRSTSNARSSGETSLRLSSETNPDISTLATLPRTSYDSLDSTVQSKSQENRVLRVNLKVTPEIENLDVEAERRIWVAVEVRRDIDMLEGTIPDIPLDVAVVVDNSLYASESCLGDACRLVVHIARLLSSPQDRLALFCTTYNHPALGSVTGCLLRPLQKTDAHAIELELRAAVDCRSKTINPDIDLSETLVAAYQLLARNNDMSSSAKTSACHVIVLSPNPAEYYGVLNSVAPVPVHLVVPSIVPAWYEQDHISGWATTTSCLCSPRSPVSTLKAIINHARRQISPGQVTNLLINIKEASTGIRIEETIGYQSYEVLPPGHSAIVLVKVHVPPWLPLLLQQPQPKSDTLLSELDGILGLAYTPLLIATINYNHSLNPATNPQTHSETIILPRLNSSSLWSCTRPTSVELLRRRRALQSEVCKRLMACISSTRSPAHALKTLAMLFPDTTKIAADVTASLTLLRSELEYQVSVLSHLQAAEREFGCGLEDHGQDTGSEHLGGGGPVCRAPVSLSAMRKVPSSSTPMRRRELSPSRSRSPSPDSADTVVRHRSLGVTKGDGSDDGGYGGEGGCLEEDAGRSGDAARRIWKCIRRDSRSGLVSVTRKGFCAGGVVGTMGTGVDFGVGMQGSMVGEEEESGMFDDRIEMIRRKALASRRSIGADTLRSFSVSLGIRGVTREEDEANGVGKEVGEERNGEEEGGGREGGVPWL